MESKSSRTVWITGASSGIGKALACLFAAHGDMVILSSRTKSKLDEVRDLIVNDGGNCKVIVCDVLSESSMNEASGKILDSYKCVDILINNAGVTYFKDFLSTTIEEFDHIVNTNLRGTFLTTKAVLPAMLKKQNGLILNILSYITKQVYTKSAGYSASKAGTEAMMNVLRAEVRSQGLNVVNIYPGAVSTPIWSDKHISKYGNQMLRSEQIAEMVYQISIQSPTLMVEEITLRPQTGDLQA
jgi:short-subunit dehydrogenase